MVIGIIEMNAVFQENVGEENTIDFIQLWVTPQPECNHKKERKSNIKDIGKKNRTWAKQREFERENGHQ